MRWVVAAAVLCVTQAAGPADDAAARKASESVVSVFGINGNTMYRGTGVVTSEGILTAYHVVSRAKELIVAFPRYDHTGTIIGDASAYQSGVKCTLFAISPIRDLALLKAPTTARAIPLAASHEIGSPIYCIGAGSGRLWHCLYGKLVDASQMNITDENMETRSGEFIQVKMGSAGGDSGGPILNGNGELLGILSGRRNDKPGIDVAVSMCEVTAFFKEVREQCKNQPRHPN